jgi:hypothetical protein
MQPFISYKVDVRNTNYQTKEFTLSHEYEGIDSIHLKFENHGEKKELTRLLIAFRFRNPLSQDEAKKMVSQPLMDILNMLTFELLVVHGEPTFHEFHNGERHTVFLRGQRDLYIQLKGSLGQDYQSIIESGLKQKSLVDQLHTNEYFRLYKAALGVVEPFARFMFLYSILELIIGNQKKIDTYILKMEPKTLMAERKQINRDHTAEIVKRTIYTTLRNEVGHTNDETPIEQVIDQMKTHIKEFEIIVKQVILETFKQAVK